ncbi:MAG: GTPase and tRNA-U34 5-formylation enzyme TrmE [Candidatus Carbobacillus altaicus]|uniref:tRNA modification GTPase MnmE n=1 Tax=Candidatus Carbonibacillus altaicus TaxID=2163959 RepID=A0A2R6Y1X7_9BACL|nr:MAG: GTPase and tRNA-U34 5-formylation enzyme TrmE [Candidatus Carbobacillus altaicus]
MQDDTIAAIATPLGEGGIAIIRVSGPTAIASVDSLFRGRRSLFQQKSFTLQYGELLDEEGRPLDEVLISVMRAPKSFTREDVVEINIHGGIRLAERVLKLLLQRGVRLAEPGEFTLRAFLNGRIDLSQAEAVIDLIRAENDHALRASAEQLRGALRERIVAFREKLLYLMAEMEVHLDYPEHDEPEATYDKVGRSLRTLLGELEAMIDESRRTQVLREGLKTAIVGRPNVGKSSLLNMLARRERAIVTDIPGTTRDVIEEIIVLAGIHLSLVDTAGLRETEDVVEKIGIERSRQAIREASLILAVFDRSHPLTLEDEALLRELAEFSQPLIYVLNKSDLPPVLHEEELLKYRQAPIVAVSATAGTGEGDLEHVLLNLLGWGEISPDEARFVANERHLGLLQKSERSLRDAVRATLDRAPYDMILIDLRHAYAALGEMIGEAVDDDVIRAIFSNFCLGK